MNYKLSIIVPVFNIEKYLEDCIVSILNQEFKEFELILIDDGSTDNSGKICDKYKLLDKRVKVTHTENRGPSSARNLGIHLSKGEYIGFVDSDDTICKSMYKKMYNLALENDAQIIACGYNEINEFTKEIKKSINPLDNKDCLEGDEIREKFEKLIVQNKILSYASMCNKIYKRSHIISNSLQLKENINIAEDLCFNISAILSSRKIVSVNESLYNYRRINTESIMNKKQDKFYMNLKAREEILKTLKQHKINQSTYSTYLRYENHKTVSDYLDKFIRVIKSNNNLLQKCKNIKCILNEKYFIEAIKEFEKSYFVPKARIIINIIEIIMYFNNLFNKINKKELV